MLNTNNYFQKSQSIDWESLPEALSKGNKLVEGASQNNWAAYNSNENIKRVVDAYFQKLSDYLDKNPSAPTQKSMPAKVVKAEPKTASPAKPAPATSSQQAGGNETLAPPVVERPPSPEPPSPRTLFRQTSAHLLNLRDVMNSQKRSSAAERYTSRLHAWPVV
jgi:hypothetical protein